MNKNASRFTTSLKKQNVDICLTEILFIFYFLLLSMYYFMKDLDQIAYPGI